MFPAREDPKEENKGLLAAVKTTFADLLSEENDGAYFLQVDSEKHGLIDLVNVRVAKDEKVFLRLWKPGGSKDEVMTLAMTVYFYYTVPMNKRSLDGMQKLYFLALSK